MAKRLPSPTDEDASRIAEAINRLDIENKIQDGNSFNRAFDDYFEQDKEIRENKGLRGKVFNDMQEIKPGLETGVIEDAPLKEARDFIFFRRISKDGIKKTVLTEKSMFKIKGKGVTRFRDRSGRFTSN